MIKTRIGILSLLLIAIFSGCKQHWSSSIKSGAVLSNIFSETIATDVSNDLIIMPVKIEDKEYRFLFDTGAILSISEELQQQHKYKTVSTGHIVDSDNNREKVRYVKVDTLRIGSIPFVHQTAFVGNFQKNPVIACLDIDGIIGSNLMRFCNWTIDYQNKFIEISKGIVVDSNLGDYVQTLPFHTSKQYGPKINFKIGKATVSNVTVDYGSNGPLTLPANSLKVLKENEIIKNTFAETGFSQSGISGNVIKINRERAFADSLHAENFLLKDIEIKTGKSGLFGSELLSRFVVTMDWDNRQFIFQPVKNTEPDHRTSGIRVGYTDSNKYYVQAVITGSPASEVGIKPGQIITKVDSIDLTSGYSLCDYIEYREEQSQDTMHITVLNDDKEEHTYTLVKRLLQ